MALLEEAYMWLAWHLPKRLVYWCAIRLMAHATVGQYGSDHPDSVSVIQALNRWDK
jgi:hypothetical protein